MKQLFDTQFSTTFRASAASALLMLIVLLEFFFTFPRWKVGEFNPRLMDIAVLGAVLLFAAFNLRHKGAEIVHLVRDHSTPILLLAAIACSALLTFFSTHHSGHSLNRLVQYLEYLFLTVFTVWAMRERPLAGDVLHMIVIMCLIEAGIGFFQQLFNYGDLHIWNIVRISGTLGYYFSSHILVGVIISAVYLMHPSTRRWTGYAAITTLLISVLVLAQVRIIWLLTALSVLILIARFRTGASLRRIATSLALGLALAAALIGASVSERKAANALPGDYVSALSERGTKTGRLRFELWTIAMNMFRDHPLTGVGLDNYKRLYLSGSYASDEFKDMMDYFYRSPEFDAHSAFFTRLAEMGILGTAAFAAFFIYLLRSAIRLVMQTPDDRAGTAIAFILMISSVADFLSDPLGGKLFWICSGLLIAMRPAGAERGLQAADHCPRVRSDRLTTRGLRIFSGKEAGH